MEWCAPEELRCAACREANLDDMAVVTGGLAIFESLGVKLTELGRVKKILVDKDNTTIIEP